MTSETRLTFEKIIVLFANKRFPIGGTLLVAID